MRGGCFSTVVVLLGGRGIERFLVWVNAWRLLLYYSSTTGRVGEGSSVCLVYVGVWLVFYYIVVLPGRRGIERFSCVGKCVRVSGSLLYGSTTGQRGRAFALCG